MCCIEIPLNFENVLTAQIKTEGKKNPYSVITSTNLKMVMEMLDEYMINNRLSKKERKKKANKQGRMRHR